MNARLFSALGNLDGPIAKAVLNLIAKYLTEHGDELFQKLLDLILGKLVPSETPTVSGSDDPVCAAFAVDLDAALAGAPE